MKVAKNNYEEVMERIHQQRWNGYEFVVFSKTVPASMDSMIFCFTAEEAKLECTQEINHRRWFSGCGRNGNSIL